MLRNLRFFFKDTLIRYTAIISGVLIIAQLVVLFVGIAPKDEPIALHYTSYLGVDYLGAWYLAYLLPMGALVVSALNFVLAYVLAPSDKLLGTLLVIGTVMISALLLVESLLLARLNS